MVSSKPIERRCAMNARDSILGAVRTVSLPTFALPDDDAQSPLDVSAVARAFVAAARATAAEVIESDRGAIVDHLETITSGATRILSAVRDVPSTVSADAGTGELARLELFVCEAILGVAENGALWLPRSRLGPRAALFLAERVVVAVHRSTLVADMHEAYRRIDPAAESFGAFVAGPSKTADIEQSLVIGAHGPKRLTVLLL